MSDSMYVAGRWNDRNVHQHELASDRPVGLGR